MSLRSPRRGVGYFLAWLDRSFCLNRRFDGRQLGVVQKPATHNLMNIVENCSSCSISGFSFQTPSARREWVLARNLQSDARRQQRRLG